MKQFFSTIFILGTIFFRANAQNVGIGTNTPQGRLEVVGEGSTSTTNTLLLKNSLGDTLLRMRNDGRMGVGFNSSIYGRTINLGGTGINFYTSNEAAFGGAIFPTDTSLVIWSNTGANNYIAIQPSFGNTGIGTYTPNAKFHVNGAQLIGNNNARTANGFALSVDGNVIAENFTTLNSTSWPDYVFEKNYSLLPLAQLSEFINTNKHLPGIPDAATMEKKGINLGEMTKKLVEKIEELTLYIIELDRKNNELTRKL